MCMYIIFDVYTCMYICTYIVAILCIHMLGKRFVCVCVFGFGERNEK